MRFRFRRRLNQLIVALYAVAILAAVAMIAGPFLNDLKIAANPQRALGTVTGVDWMRTAVGIIESSHIRVVRVADNMRNVAVTEGDKVEAQMKFGWEIDAYPVNELSLIHI